MELNLSLDQLIKGEKKGKKNVKEVAVAQSKASSKKRANKLNRNRGIKQEERSALPPPPAIKEVKSFKISVKNDNKIVGPKIDAPLKVSVSRRNSSPKRSSLKQRSSLRPTDIKISTQNSIRRNSNRGGKTSTSNSTSFRDSRQRRQRNNNNNDNNNENNNNVKSNNNNNNINNNNGGNSNGETKFTITTGATPQPIIFSTAPVVPAASRIVQNSFPVQQTPQDNSLSAILSTFNGQQSGGASLNERFTRMRQNLDQNNYF